MRRESGLFVYPLEYKHHEKMNLFEESGPQIRWPMNMIDTRGLKSPVDGSNTLVMVNEKTGSYFVFFNFSKIWFF